MLDGIAYMFNTDDDTTTRSEAGDSSLNIYQSTHFWPSGADDAGAVPQRKPKRPDRDIQQLTRVYHAILGRRRIGNKNKRGFRFQRLL